MLHFHKKICWPTAACSTCKASTHFPRIFGGGKKEIRQETPLISHISSYFYFFLPPSVWVKLWIRRTSGSTYKTLGGGGPSSFFFFSFFWRQKCITWRTTHTFPTKSFLKHCYLRRKFLKNVCSKQRCSPQKKQNTPPPIFIASVFGRKEVIRHTASRFPYLGILGTELGKKEGKVGKSCIWGRTKSVYIYFSLSPSKSRPGEASSPPFRKIETRSEYLMPGKWVCWKWKHFPPVSISLFSPSRFIFKLHNFLLQGLFGKIKKYFNWCL